MDIHIDYQEKNAVYLSQCHRYESGLETLELYRNCPPSIAHGVFKSAVGHYQTTSDLADNGDRAHIAARNAARAVVTELLKKIVSYIRSVATEEDIPALIQAGFDVRVRTSRRRKSVVAPA